MSGEYSEDGIFASTVGAWLKARREIEGPRPTACDTPLRGSYAYKCARQIAFILARVLETNETPLHSLIAMELGTAMHDLSQEALEAMFVDFEKEVVVDLRPLGFDISGHADWVNFLGEVGPEDARRPRKLLGELKTQPSYGFKLARKSGEPKIEHVAQAAMYAVGLDADAIHLVYLAKENGQFRDGIKPGHVLEWIYPMDMVFHGETIRDIGLGEMYRLQRVWERVQQGVIPERDIPEFGPVDTPPQFQGDGQPWNCRFCNYRDACAPLPTEGVPVTLATTAVQESWNPPLYEREAVS